MSSPPLPPTSLSGSTRSSPMVQLPLEDTVTQLRAVLKRFDENGVAMELNAPKDLAAVCKTVHQSAAEHELLLTSGSLTSNPIQSGYHTPKAMNINCHACAHTRRIAENTVSTLETTIALMKETIKGAMALAPHFVPLTVVEEKTAYFKKLLDDAKSVLKSPTSGGFPLNTNSQGSTHSLLSGSATRSLRRLSTESLGSRSMEIYASMYDTSIIHPKLRRDETDEDEGELMYLKSRVRELLFEKAELSEKLTASERAVEELQTRVSQADVQAQNFLENTTTKLRVLEDRMRAAGEALPEALAPAVSADDLHSQIRRQQSEIRGLKNTNMVASQSPPTSPIASPDKQRDQMATPEFGDSVNIGPAPPRRYLRVDALYKDVFDRKGMEMLWSCVDTVFKHQFLSPCVQGDDFLVSPNRAADMTKESMTTALKKFQTDFGEAIGAVVNDTDAFLQRIDTAETPLRSAYVAHCMAAKVKPNSGISRLFASAVCDSHITSLVLNGNYIGDAGLIALIPLISRLFCLVSLELSENGLRNQSVHALVPELMRHPTVAKLDLSHNNISRLGGKDLLMLASAVPRITHINVDGTKIEHLLQQRILKRVEQNASLLPPSAATNNSSGSTVGAADEVSSATGSKRPSPTTSGTPSGVAVPTPPPPPPPLS